MTEQKFSQIAKKIVLDYYSNNYAEKNVTMDDIFIAWECKILQNNKAMLSTTTAKDGKYFELTYNGDKNEGYLDVYKKEKNEVIAL